jgi:hypothetical protein
MAISCELKYKGKGLQHSDETTKKANLFGISEFTKAVGPSSTFNMACYYAKS